MTSHKEQPAVDTSAEADMLAALLACQSALAMMIAPDAIKQTSVLNAFAQATEAEAQARAAIAKATEGGSLAAHPAEPVEMELETTAEWRADRPQTLTQRGYPNADECRVLRDFDRMRARAEKAEAALKQPVSDEEELANRLGAEIETLLGENGGDFLKEINAAELVEAHLLPVLTTLSTQLRDAQARTAP